MIVGGYYGGGVNTQAFPGEAVGVSTHVFNGYAVEYNGPCSCVGEFDAGDAGEFIVGLFKAVKVVEGGAVELLGVLLNTPFSQ